MHAVVRTYSGKGSKKLIDVIEQNKPEVERLIRSSSPAQTTCPAQTMSS